MYQVKTTLFSSDNEQRHVDLGTWFVYWRTLFDVIVLLIDCTCITGE